MTDIFTYVASNDPEAARALCGKYGYAVQGVNQPEDLGVCLEQLVGEVGEPAMLDIYSIHPDKDQLIALYGSGANKPAKDDCGCHKKKNQKTIGSYLSQISSGNNQTTIQVCIITGTVLLSLAIIYNSNSK